MLKTRINTWLFYRAVELGYTPMYRYMWHGNVMVAWKKTHVAFCHS